MASPFLRGAETPRVCAPLCDCTRGFVLEKVPTSCQQAIELQGDDYCAGLKPVRRQSRHGVSAACHGNELCLLSSFMPNVLQRTPSYVRVLNDATVNFQMAKNRGRTVSRSARNANIGDRTRFRMIAFRASPCRVWKVARPVRGCGGGRVFRCPGAAALRRRKIDWRAASTDSAAPPQAACRERP